ncbi:MAG: hypothetical protein JXN63_02255 [Candidatus Delongbacteria bacterium]|nr:hypothetical protein [Candidatus Delongbacteria bacterium]
MNSGVLKKDLKVFFRNKTVLVSLSVLLALEFFLAFYSAGIVSEGSGGRSLQFYFMQNHLIIFFFPVLSVNILVLAFSLTSEKNDLMLAKMLPYGERSFIRSKAALSSIVSSFLGFIYIFAVIYAGKMTVFTELDFLSFLIFYLLFSVISISGFSIYYAVTFYDRENNFEPDIKGIFGLMFFLTLLVVSSYGLLVRNLRAYFEFVTGFSQYYPNKILIISLLCVFSFLIFTRIMLNRAERIYETK